MRLEEPECRWRFASVSRAVLATCGTDRWPHLVPVTFAVEADLVVVAVDHKPKASTDLRRLRNIADNPQVAFLADHYAEDWTHLWWVRADAVAVVTAQGPGWKDAVDLLRERYPQYRTQPPEGPVIRASVQRWSGWAASPGGRARE